MLGVGGAGDEERVRRVGEEPGEADLGWGRLQFGGDLLNLGDVADVPQVLESGGSL